MNRDNSDLKYILDTVDNWFSDTAYKTPLNSSTRCTLEDDQLKLTQINKTTSRWFSSLAETLTDEGIENEEDNQQTGLSYVCVLANRTVPPNDKVITKPKVTSHRNTRVHKPQTTASRKKFAPRKEQNIEKLAKDLERILEQADEVPKSPTHSFEYFNTYSDSELALLDETIGASYTLVNSNRNIVIETDKVNSASKWSCLVDNSKSVVSKFSQPNTRKKLYNTNHNYCRHRSDQHSITEQTPLLLLGHDYLPRVPAKPLVLNNKLVQWARHTRVQVPALNVAALRRFARFSDQFRRVSIEHDRVLAICNE